MNALFLLAVVSMAAPVPRATHHEGRITIWIDDSLIQMKPDGSDVIKVPLDQILIFRIGGFI